MIYTDTPDIPEVSLNKFYPKATAKLQHLNYNTKQRQDKTRQDKTTRFI